MHTQLLFRGSRSYLLSLDGLRLLPTRKQRYASKAGPCAEMLPVRCGAIRVLLLLLVLIAAAAAAAAAAAEFDSIR